ncbi:hypothetical protein C8034_v003374 [Colletotrichum sidae]|uniref:Uncharacterized protein n=1 Tax=Colletotrichum sidae TaxID=1347389 RepID=A0A4R8TAP3_9PEZI|nr:hypothetical protein C8034_v003374 [Colletotrichum sidae]
MGRELDPYVRAAILALRSRVGARTPQEVADALGISRRVVDHTLKRAKDNGFVPEAATLTILPIHVTSAPRSGRPKKITSESTDLVSQEQTQIGGAVEDSPVQVDP